MGEIDAQKTQKLKKFSHLKQTNITCTDLFLDIYIYIHT